MLYFPYAVYSTLCMYILSTTYYNDVAIVDRIKYYYDDNNTYMRILYSFILSSDALPVQDDGFTVTRTAEDAHRLMFTFMPA